MQDMTKSVATLNDQIIRVNQEFRQVHTAQIIQINLLETLG